MRIIDMGNSLKKALIFLALPLAGMINHVTAQPALDNYIKEGQNANLVLKSRNVSLEKSLLALKEARSFYLPTSWFDGQYTFARGGRAISFPVGDLLNPVYQTLNQITGTEKFPPVSNVNEQLLPNNFYDLRIKTSMPLINQEIRYNRNIKQQEVLLKENEINLYKRELIREIKTAYYSILMAKQAISIYQQALLVVNQNLRLNQSLLANGKGLPAYVSRAESEVKVVETQLQNAENDMRKASAYFNALLNRELSEPVELEEPPLIPYTLNETSGYTENISGREELKSLQLSRGIQSQVFRMNKSYRTPKLNAFLDLAAQDFNFRVNRQSFFYLGGLQMTVPIFAGNRNLYKIKQTELDLKQLELMTSNTRKQIELAAFTSKSNAASHYSNYISSLKQEESAAVYFRLIERGYKEGINNYIELLDARNQHTQSQLQSALNKFRYLASMADYERQTSSYLIN